MEAETLPARTYHRLLDSVPPAAGAIVMGTGIVSVALLLDDRDVLSTILLVLDGMFWIALAVLLPARALRDGRRFAAALRHPPALTSIAGTAVLGSRLTLSGWDWAGVVLLIIATVMWLGLVPHVLRHWHTPTIGASFLLAVATDSLALLAATLAFADRTGWLVYAALASLAVALCFYIFVLSRFELRQLAVGLGDQWVTGGALAISTLATGQIVLAAERTGTLAGGHDVLQTTALVLWCLTMAWLPALIVTEILRPQLHYDLHRWSTAFPFGMYAACSFIVGTVCKLEGITTFAQVWVWIALAVWVVVFAAMTRRTPNLLRPEPRLGGAAGCC